MVVLDTSFVVKFVKQEVPMSFFEEDKKFITTDLFDYEFANVMWKTAKYQGLSTSEVRAFFTLVESLEIERYKTDAIQLFSYATETGLTAYDASYLLLAKKYNCEIATFDKQLLLAAEKENVRIAIC